MRARWLKSSSVSTHEIARRLGLALDRAGNLESGGRRRPVLAPAGGHEQQSAGSGALGHVSIYATGAEPQSNRGSE
jgi:hypothetical protein